MNALEKLITLLCGGFALWFSLSLGVLALAQKTCLEAGFPSAKIDAALTAYCVKRVDQTDVVVTVDQIKKDKQGAE
jgi:hypothetical protein